MTLETIPAPDGEYAVTFRTDELTAICPFDFGGPDYYGLLIRYEPDAELIESKSLKEYLQTYRNEELTVETLANRIHSDITEAAEPKRCYVWLEQARRGGIKETVEVGENPV